MQIHYVNFIVQIQFCKFCCINFVMQYSLICQTGKQSQVFYSTVSDVLIETHNLIKCKFNI